MDWLLFNTQVIVTINSAIQKRCEAITAITEGEHNFCALP